MRGWEGKKSERFEEWLMNSNQADNSFFADTIQTWRKAEYICYSSGRAPAAQGMTDKV